MIIETHWAQSGDTYIQQSYRVDIHGNLFFVWSLKQVTSVVFA